MSVCPQLLHIINQIVEELSPEECKRLSYLCGVLDTDRRAANVRETLLAVMSQVETDYAFLMELMLRMRRYDLLKCVLGTTKTEAEVRLKNSHSLSEYRVLMAELSEDIGLEDLESLVFLLRGILPKEKLETVECFLDVVVELERLDEISSSRMEVMERYLRAIHRVDLAKKLSQYQSRATRSEQTSSLLKSTNEQPPPRGSSQSIQSGNPPTHCSEGQVLSRCVSPAALQRTSNISTWERQEVVYRMKSKPRGVCVIIDCVGTEGVLLEKVFKSLHFCVRLHLLLSIQDMFSTLQDVSRLREHYTADAFVCCIISRSYNSELLGTNPCGPGLSLDLVRHLFTPDFCPGLAGKPKLFFVQGYDVPEPQRFGGSVEIWDQGAGYLQTDGPTHALFRPKTLPADADVFWSHCWTQEQQLESVNHHSVYLQSLRHALQEGQKGRIHLVDVHMSVNRAVYDYNYKKPGSPYHINLRHTLRKNIYMS